MSRKTPTTDARAAAALRWLEKHSSKAVRRGMLRYAIPNDQALGVRMGDIQKLGRQLGRDHALALALWQTGVYEARMLCAYVDEPERVTAAQMDAWARAFDNWAVCDTLCFALWVHTPHALARIRAWASRPQEFVKRAAFALLASVALRDREASDAQLRRCLRLVQKAASDERNFVKKGVSWALRGIGERNVALHADALALAGRLAESADPASRWVGRDALRQLSSASVKRRLAKKASG